jgi:hypothetical protein
MGTVVRPIVEIAVAVEDPVVVVAERAPPTIRLFPFHPIARAPVFIVFTSSVLAPEISENRSADPLTSVHTRPSPDIAIVAVRPLPTATQRCPGATVFDVEYEFHEIPSLDHAIIFPLLPDEYAGPVATNRLPFQEIEVEPYGNKFIEFGTPVQRAPVFA